MVIQERLQKKTAKLLIGVLVAVMILSSLLMVTKSAYAAEPNANYIKIRTGTQYAGKELTWAFPYADSMFLGNTDEYNNDLARASLGMTFAAVRDTTVDLPLQGHYISDFFEDAGFEDIDVSSYAFEPETDSIAYGLAHKKIGKSTLIAIGVCGGNYGKEWGGNFRVGDGAEHEGFRIATDKLKSAIEKYKSDYNISGSTIAWVSGFSRAGAVSNLLAADLTKSSEYERVYAYCFAPPNNTREPVKYSNIFNIVGKDDPVPRIPFKEWGFGRHGITLYNPSSSTDSDFHEKALNAEIINEQLLGRAFYDNADLNLDFIKICSYFNDLLPTAEKYKELFQDALVGAFDGNTDNLFSILLTALNKMRVENEEDKYTLDSLVEFLTVKLNSYLFKNNIDQKNSNRWNPDVSISENLLVEHNTLRYIVWLFSFDDPKGFYTDDCKFRTFSFFLSGDINVYNEDELISTFKDGVEIITGADDILNKELDSVNVINNGTGYHVLLPINEYYRIEFYPYHSEESLVGYLEFSCDRVKQDSFIVQNIEAGKGIPIIVEFKKNKAGDYSIKSSPFNKNILNMLKKHVKDFKAIYFMPLEVAGNSAVRVEELIVLFYVVLVAFAIGLVLGIILAIIRLIRKKKRVPAMSIIFHGIYSVGLFYVSVNLWYYFSGIRMVPIVFEVGAYIFLIIMALKGCALTKTRKAFITVACVFAVAILEIILSYHLLLEFSLTLIIIKILIFVAEFVVSSIFCYDLIKSKKISEKQIL